ncbi:PIN domain-containing protein [Clostridium sp. D53t1_180928_C8]|uniref:PIN domain-containing protein n=1 Tax=Clostridium sp. D53t1_180928_C8 TaxID=2787101 RepID=UPI0018AC5E16|nr:PIN domain-containing protein [Clostridium sp. D53t1_180928_C8]
MKKYLLDTNIIIRFWDEEEKQLDKIIRENKVVILTDVLNELSVKETKEYRRREVLSERFCKLLPYSIEVEKDNISGFYMIFDYESKENFNSNNLSQNDLLQLYACYINDDLNLVTEDKELYNIARHILGEKRVLSIKELNNII